ncbi:MAG: GspE/PulE family protein [Candidatus Omnitrophota bacterium]
MQKLNLEQSLVDEKIISDEQLRMVKLEQQRSSATLVQALRRLNFIAEDNLINFLSAKLNLPKFSLTDFNSEEDLANLFPSEFLWKEKVIPLFKNRDELAVGMLDPLDLSMLEELRFRTGMFIKPHLVKEEELNAALTRFSDRRKSREKLTAQPEGLSGGQQQAVDDGVKPSVVEAVNLLLLQALRVNASDVHIEPHKDKMRLRLRVDGVLAEISPPEREVYNAFVSRIKIMSNMDIAEKRIPQDGRFNVELEDTALDVRVSVIPTIQGESVVLRLLKQSKKILTLQQIGISEENLKIYLRLVYKPSGILLVTGPTGSGKTTTLYATLSMLKTVERNIITIEDPVEYQLDFCRQIQVNPKVNLTFAAGLRSILRHDPDIIMVGEIRDLETATIAIQSALTGHLVISTLHTNDAVSAITRLVDMGIEPFLIASCLNGAVAQRLVRVLCPKCKKLTKEIKLKIEYPGLSDANYELIKAKGVYQPQGCQACLNTGYSGRLAVFEIMEMNPEVGRQTVEKVSSDTIARYCRQQGMKFLYDDGWQKVIDGVTCPQELVRVLGVI